jgi:hypothetical protein
MNAAANVNVDAMNNVDTNISVNTGMSGNSLVAYDNDGMNHHHDASSVDQQQASFASTAVVDINVLTLVSVNDITLGIDSNSPTTITNTHQQQLASRWNERYTQLVAFKNVHGHCNVPLRKERKELGEWVKRVSCSLHWKCREVAKGQFSLYRYSLIISPHVSSIILSTPKATKRTPQTPLQQTHLPHTPASSTPHFPQLSISCQSIVGGAV